MNQDDEIKLLAEKALLIISFLEESNGDPSIFSPKVRDVINKTLLDNNLKGMEIICKDMFEASEALSSIKRQELNEALLGISSERKGNT